jgi:hypothetical protein
MHYKNGREAHNGDKVLMHSFGKIVVGVLIDAVAGNDTCNGAIIPLQTCPHYANLSECLHIEDAVKQLGVQVQS